MCADLILGRVFLDVCILFSSRSCQGFLYFVTWVDDKSRKVFVSAMKEKSKVAQHLRTFVACVELETGQKLKVLRSDGGGEYTAGEVQSFLKEKGIKHELTTADTPQHNGVAEHMNRTLVERVRTMLVEAELPDTYWWDALRYATLLHNVSPTRSLSDSTPKESWSGNKPDVSRLHVFSCRAFVHIPNKLCGKLSAKSLVCTFIGYAQQRKAYHLVHRLSKRFIDSRCYVLGLTQGAFFIFHLLTKPFPSRDQPPIHLDHMTNHLTSHLTSHMTSHMPFQSPAPQSYLVLYHLLPSHLHIT